MLCGQSMPILFLVLLLPPLANSGPVDPAAILGSWEGESLCTIPDSPCHNEQALYQLAADKKDPAKISISAYKIVNGTPDFMGTISCNYSARDSKLSCAANTTKQDLWEFLVSGNSMTGTLRIGPEKTLYRRITLRKSQSKEH